MYDSIWQGERGNLRLAIFHAEKTKQVSLAVRSLFPWLAWPFPTLSGHPAIKVQVFTVATQNSSHNLACSLLCVSLSYVTRKYSSQSSFCSKQPVLDKEVLLRENRPAFFCSAMPFCPSKVSPLLQRILQTVLLESRCSPGPYPLC